MHMGPYLQGLTEKEADEQNVETIATMKEADEILLLLPKAIF